MDEIFVFLLCFCFSSAQIKITNLNVPSSILYGSQEDVVLDCAFESGGDPVTEIKWFLNENTQIYQWLPENPRAQGIGKFKNHIDATYKATDDKRTMYRALHMTNLTTDLSGNYTCKVSGPESEDAKTKRMIIYVTPDSDTSDDDYDDSILDLSVSEETLEITCSTGRYYPRPNLTLYITDDNETEIVLQQDNETIDLRPDGYYNVSATLSFNSSDLPQTFRYVCELNLPGTPYNISESGIHIQEDSGEAQVDEELLDAVNSTESSFAEEQATESQIEEESVTSATENATNIDDDVTKVEAQNLGGDVCHFNNRVVDNVFVLV